MKMRKHNFNQPKQKNISPSWPSTDKALQDIKICPLEGSLTFSRGTYLYIEIKDEPGKLLDRNLIVHSISSSTIYSKS